MDRGANQAERELLSSIVHAFLENLEGENTAHLQGLKYVFLRNGETGTSLTQFAKGVFQVGEVCDWHLHPTMEEFFFVISGCGKYWLEEENYPLKAGVFLRIPAGVRHRLEQLGEMPLEFIYFGIATT